jgi:hypothetical protein
MCPASIKFHHAVRIFIASMKIKKIVSCLSGSFLTTDASFERGLGMLQLVVDAVSDATRA